MADPLGAPRGTRDILAPEVRIWQLMENVGRAVFDRYGFDEIRTPAFEATELFSRGIGDETDIVGKEMYSFTDRGDRPITLRPEGTAGVVRAFLEHKLHGGPLPLKVWYQGPMFRYERPQKGRQRQFHQIGAEVFGSAEPLTDAEAIALAWEFYQTLFAAVRAAVEAFVPPAAAESGGQAIASENRSIEFPELVVQVNTLGDENCRPVFRAALQGYFRTHVEAYCEDCRRRMETNPLRVLDCKVPSCGELNRAAPVLQPCPACQEHFAAVGQLLRLANVPFTINPRIVRGLDYYTRTVFEIVPEAASRFGQSTVCAGGRYDRLVSDLGGPPTPAFGWALGQERVADLIAATLDRGALPKAAPALTIGALVPEALPAAFELAQRLRQHGLAIALAPQSGKPDKHLKLAIRLGSRQLALIGIDELARGEVAVKDLETRQQRAMRAQDLEAELLGRSDSRSLSIRT